MAADPPLKLLGFCCDREKIKIPKEKPYVTIEGAGANKTVLSCHDYAGKVNSTYKSASFAVMSDYFIAKDVTFEVKLIRRHRDFLSGFYNQI